MEQRPRLLGASLANILGLHQMYQRHQHQQYIISQIKLPKTHLLCLPLFNNVGHQLILFLNILLVPKGSMLI
jgi:hypothetical protein